MPRITDRGGYKDWILKEMKQEVITDEIDMTGTGTHYLYEFQNDARITRITVIYNTDADDTAGQFGKFTVGTDSDADHFVAEVTLTDDEDAGDCDDQTLASKDVSADDKLVLTVGTADMAATARFVVEFIEDVAV